MTICFLKNIFLFCAKEVYFAEKKIDVRKKEKKRERKKEGKKERKKERKKKGREEIGIIKC